MKKSKTQTILSNQKKEDEIIYWGERPQLSKAIIEEQVSDIENNFIKNGAVLRGNDCNYILIERFIVPKKWRNAVGVENGVTELAIVFPTYYPKIPPYGFYLKAVLPLAPRDRYFTQYADEYKNADKKFIRNGWMWYSLYKANDWKPAAFNMKLDWRKGDNLWQIFQRIKKVLNEEIFES